MDGQRIDARFESTLDKFDLATLEHEPGAVFALWSDLTLCYLNPGWFRFAEENDGLEALAAYPLGASIAEAISGPLQRYYVETFAAVLQSGQPWGHDYECSSADVQRYYHQSVYPTVKGKALVVVNSLLRSGPHDPAERPAMPPLEPLYRDDNGFITQCGHCRRVQRPDAPARWDWVPAWARRIPVNTSHSLCRVCYDYYYEHYRA